MEPVPKKIKLEEEAQGSPVTKSPSGFVPTSSAADWESPTSVTDPAIQPEPFVHVPETTFAAIKLEETLMEDWQREEEEILAEEPLEHFISRSCQVEKERQKFIQITHTINLPAPVHFRELHFVHKELQALDRRIKSQREAWNNPTPPPLHPVAIKQEEESDTESVERDIDSYPLEERHFRSYLRFGFIPEYPSRQFNLIPKHIKEGSIAEINTWAGQNLHFSISRDGPRDKHHKI